jgi:hypothetical protein
MKMTHDKYQPSQANQIVKILRQFGCQILSARKTPKGAIINITQPTHAMVQQAISISQTQQGAPSTLSSVCINHCTVYWQQGARK